MATDEERLAWLDFLIEDAESRHEEANEIVSKFSERLTAFRDLRDRFAELTEPVPPEPEPEPEPTESPMGLGFDADGRTRVTRNHVIHVIADGATGAWCKTLDEAQARMDADPGIDTVWIYGPVKSSLQWRHSGGSAQRPILIEGMTPDAEINRLWSDKPFSNLAIIDLKLSGGPLFGQPGENLLFEGCTFTGPGTGCVVQGERPAAPGIKQWNNVWWRFCRFLDCFNLTDRAQGLFFHGLKDWGVEYCLFDGNGWDATRPRDDGMDISQTGAGHQLRSHNLYVGMPSGPGIVRYNVFSRPASHGVHLRSGGMLVENLFLRCPIAWQLGYSYANDNGLEYGPVTGVVANNIAIGSSDISGDNPRGVFGILEHYHNVIVDHNAALFNETGAVNDVGISWTGKGTTGITAVINNLGYQWTSAAYRNPPEHLEERDNRWYSPDLGDSTFLRSLATDEWIEGFRKTGFTTKQEAEELMAKAWGAIG